MIPRVTWVPAAAGVETADVLSYRCEVESEVGGELCSFRVTEPGREEVPIASGQHLRPRTAKLLAVQHAFKQAVIDLEAALRREGRTE